jgi:alginate O-acetyltransferase complex protein AlgI
MPFHSAAFLLLLVPTFSVYYLRCTQRWQHFVLFVSSFAFYYFAGVRDLAILLGTTAFNYAVAVFLPLRLGAALGVVASLGVLAFFKYRSFLGGLFGYDGDYLSIVSIPLGISFYVFQLIAYQVDRTRGLVQVERSFPKLLLYILFFPHHQAGPIMRPAAFLPQFVGPKDPRIEQIATGARWILWGLFKKVLADRIGAVTDPLFATPAAHVSDAWSAALGYSAQIYLDFSGYSDMAVGLGLLFGYRLDRNFNQPYLAASPSEFWERWHITLSAWLRDYLYIPLGGNRHGKARTQANLMATMALGGLWHGASWNFVAWGVLHGLLLVVYRAFPNLVRGPRALRVCVLQLAVVFCWIPFRARTFGQTLGLWGAMVGLNHTPLGSARVWLALAAGTAVFAVAHGLEHRMLGDSGRRERALAAWTRVPPALRGVGGALVLAGCCLLLLDGTTFIYFRF